MFISMKDFRLTQNNEKYFILCQTTKVLHIYGYFSNNLIPLFFRYRKKCTKNYKLSNKHNINLRLIQQNKNSYVS